MYPKTVASVKESFVAEKAKKEEKIFLGGRYAMTQYISSSNVGGSYA